MKYFVILLILIGLSGLTVPQSFADNAFCNISENLKNQEELIKDDLVLIEFLKLFPDAKLTRANYIDESNPEQTSMIWTAREVYSLSIHIWGFDENNPSDCFVPGGYRLNAPHLPEMVGLDYHKDPKIVLEQIKELDSKYIKDDDSSLMLLKEKLDDPTCGPNTKLENGICVIIDGIFTPDCGEGTEYVNGVCTIITAESSSHYVNTSPFYQALLMFSLFLWPYFISGVAIFIVLAKTPRYKKSTRIAVTLFGSLVIIWFLVMMFMGIWPQFGD